MQQMFLLQILLRAQHVSGTIMPIIRSSKVLYRWFLPVVFGALVFKLSVWCGPGGNVSGLQPAKRLLHLVGTLFPHITVTSYALGHNIPMCNVKYTELNKHLIPNIFLPHKQKALYAE